ncbi:MAG: Ig-like domain-containing protein, partial [Bacteroidales bacterium]|nr:Ig-like domain-containing protein [Candidatus Cryptobacteroides aphodequi]
EVTYINGSSVFVQDATGWLLLYGTGLESAGAYVGLRFKGAFTVTAKVFNGVPEITGITDGLAGMSKDYNAKYPCVNLTLAELVADYDKYLNCKVKVSGVTVKDGWQGTTDRNGVINVAETELNVYCQDKTDTLQVKTGCEGNIVGFPTYYKTTKQIGFWPADYANGKSFFTVTKEASEDDGGGSGEETIYANCGELNAAILKLGASKDTLYFKANFTTNAEITLMGADSKSIFVQDATGALQIFSETIYASLKAIGAQAGIALTGEFSGKAVMFNYHPEIVSVDVSKAQIKQTWGFPCKNLTVAELTADFEKYANCKVKIADVEVTDGWTKTDRNGIVKQGDNTLPVYVKNTNITDEITAGTKGALVGYVSFTKKDNKPVGQVSYWEDGKFIATEIASVITMPKTLSLEPGSTQALNAKTNSTATITYSTDNANVATVSDAGVVTAVAAGSATITASVAAAGLYTKASAECAVTVTAVAATTYYQKVTSAPSDWTGPVLIAYSDAKFMDGALDGGTSSGCIGAGGTAVAPGSALVGDKIDAQWGDAHCLFIEPIDKDDLSKGYLLKTQGSKPYIYHTSNSSNGLSATDKAATASAYPITINFVSSSDVQFCPGGNATGSILHYNADANTGDMFRFYKKGGQEKVYVYRKVSAK